MDPISSLSRVYVKTFIRGAVGDEQVEIAFTASGAEPADGDWHLAQWGGRTSEGCEAQILVGPGAGAVALDDGTYQMWARVTGPVQIPVLPAGLVSIT